LKLFRFLVENKLFVSTLLPIVLHPFGVSSTVIG